MAAERLIERMSYHPQRVTRRRPCEICGRDHYCGYDPRAGVAFCTKLENATGQTFGAWGWIHTVDATPNEYNPNVVKSSRPKVELSPEECAARNLLYGHLAKHCRLTNSDTRELKARTLTAEQIARHGYFSFPAPEHTRDAGDYLHSLVARDSLVARRWNKEHPDLSLGVALDRLPGVYRQSKRSKKGGYFYNLSSVVVGHGDIVDRLAIPVRNARGETIALRIRIPGDAALHRKKKLVWVSSSAKNGTSPGAPIHVAYPATITDTRIFVTEGEIKANISADLLGAIVLSLPGFAQGDGLGDVLDELKALGYAGDVVMALDQDADAATRAKVQAKAKTYAATLTRQGYTVSLATWDGAKGLDDLLVAGGKLVVAPFAAPRQRGLVPMAPVTYGADSVLSSMPDAEWQLEEIAKQIIPAKWPRGVKSMETFVLLATMGLGKTHNVLRRLDALDRSDAWPTVWNVKNQSKRDVRVLVLVDSVNILEESTRKHFGAVWTTDVYEENGVQKSRLVWDYAKQNRPTFFVMEGRNAAPHSGGFCANMAIAGEVSERRGLPIVDACRVGKEIPCPFAEQCQVDGYLAAKKASKAARIVCACKSAYLNESKELDDFDLVIMDEETARAFLEEIAVTTGDVEQWRKLLAERDPIGEFCKLDVFLAWMQSASNHAKAHGEGALFPAMPHWRATAPADALDVLQAARLAAQYNTGGKGRTFFRAICEEIRDGDRTIAMRALHDITQGLLNEWERDPNADTRLRFTEAGTLTYLHPRLGLIMRLFARRVAILDATGDPEMLRRIHAIATSEMATTPPLTFLHVQVKHSIRLTQISDSLYGRKTLGKDGGVRWHAIEETVAAMAKRLGIPAKQVARLTYKLFNPNDATSETAGEDVFVTGHYGLDNKATNRFYNEETQCRMLVTIGNHTPNIGDIIAMVEAWRFSAEPRKTGKHFTTICYPGKSEGVERPVADDPDVQRAIQHATWAAETQALGRMRDIRRPDETLHWVRFNRDPYIPPAPEYQAVPVTTLTTHNHLRMQLGLPTIEVYSATQKAPLRAENERRRKAAEAKCAAAARELFAEGREVTANAIATRAGVNYNRAKSWLDEANARMAARPAAPPPVQPQPARRVDPSTVPSWPATVTAFADQVRWLMTHRVDEDSAIAFTLANRPQRVYVQEAG